MGNYKYKGTGNNGSFAWFMQRISGVVIALMGTIVFIEIALSRDPNTHKMDPWMLMPLLSFGIWHTFSGFKMITDDFVSCKMVRLGLQIFYWGLGVATFLFGIYLIISKNVNL